MHKLYWSIFAVLLAICGFAWFEWRFNNKYITPFVERLDRLSSQVTKLNWDLNHPNIKPSLKPSSQPETDEIKPVRPEPPNETPKPINPINPIDPINPVDENPIETAYGNDLYVFSIGTTWEFEHVIEADGRKKISTMTYTVNGRTKDSTIILIDSNNYVTWSINDGCLVWAYKDSDTIKMLKLNSEKGDTWKAIGATIEATNLGTTIVNTPSGQYIAIRTVINVVIDDYKADIECSFVHGTGPVKLVIKSDVMTSTLLLKKFTKK